MPMKYMDNQEMIAASDSWVTVGEKANSVLMARELTAPMVAMAAQAHDNLVELTVPRKSLIATLKLEQGTVDIRHDSLVRAIIKRLESEEELATDPAVKARLRRLRETLFSEGISLVNRSYQYEAGHGRIVASQLDSDTRALLSTLSTHSGTLLQAVEEYIDLTIKLGQLDEERALVNDTPSPSRQENLKARNFWIRVMTMIRDSAELIAENDVELTEVLKQLDHAEEQATRRHLARNQDTSPSTDDVTDAEQPTPESGTEPTGDGATDEPAAGEPAADAAEPGASQSGA